MMICQENVTTILMLTELKENGFVKCEQYWPEVKCKYRWGEFLIENLSTKTFPNYFLRKLQMQYKNKTRFVNQFQYVTWPDHGIPLDTRAFIEFNTEIEKIPQHSPIVVHCNAGCGRTGTYILCDIMLQMGIEEQEVDFLKVLQQMREQRSNLVSNVEQYIFAHYVVFEYFFRKDSSITITENFQDDVYKSLETNSLKILKDNIDKAANQDEKTRFKLNSHLTDEEKRKNRFDSILPGHSQIYLPVSSEESSSYINAISVDCYRCPKKFIVTQQPLPNTVKDFWKLINEYEIDTIVSLNEIIENDLDCPRFWPDKSQPRLILDDSLTISFLKKNTTDECIIVKVKVENTAEGSVKKNVHILNMKYWKRETLKPLRVQNLIQVWRKVTMNGKKVVVTCYDGATASGLFVALAYLLEKINMDQICDVFSAVRTVRQSRPQFVQHTEQLEFLYQAVVEYIQGFSNYGNFHR